ncbi:hypothetical protein Q73_05020 [Bacillus coahuilensis m2-6]|uniref:DUF177 domain-containing protein n=1 Tax=Bacillus coahuilensis p1.1.43 TaxID=1150625 RepID=A0A147KA35_9BACI|nr:YceD family protein [Bacillus coahuilensis]KUP07325.1 hypothetical protein Q75_05575 [Bacillus coahuilensis p1.1.43]KUP08556.1 hypothetical protein Q73_05020 [Bacillus coahuilensis m2-6]
MKWSIIQLQKYRSEGLAIDEHVNMDSVKNIEKDIRSLSPFHVTGHADIRPKQVTFHLNIKGEMILPCSRTLADVHFPLNIQTTETFIVEDNLYDDDTEVDEVHRVNGEVIDLTPVIEELIVLEVPLQVFSEQALDAELPSGKDWEVVTEEKIQEDSQDEEKQKVDPRLRDLAKFFETDS